MDLFHKLMELVDKNTENIPEGDYLQMCDTIKKLRERVRPPSFLLDQNQPLWVSEETGVNENLPVYDRDFYSLPYEATLPTSTTDFANLANLVDNTDTGQWEGVRMRGNTDEMTETDLALVARAVAHETFIAEANYVVQNGHS